VLSVEPLWTLMHENGIFPGENGLLLKELYSFAEEPLEHLLRAPNVTVKGDAEEAIRADHERRQQRIAEKRAANPRYKPAENDPPWRI
jgi:hypothetical protein